MRLSCWHHVATQSALQTGLVYLMVIWMKNLLHFSFSANKDMAWRKEEELRDRWRKGKYVKESGSGKWGQKGRFSLWHVSWWKDHFSPYLGFVFSSLPPFPPSLRVPVPLITHCDVCPGTAGMAEMAITTGAVSVPCPDTNGIHTENMKPVVF